MCFKCFSINILIIFLLKSDINCSENTISVRIKNGEIIGKVDSSGLTTFLGIPYAEPPIKELRFKKPLPIGPWSAAKEALKWPKPCFQKAPRLENFQNQELSEDCLYLNIWSPNNVSQASDELRPVMFWIHGGALFYGSSVAKFYSGHVLSTKGDVVVVTINYRLNTFGFLYTGTDDGPGNMGLWDQALALEWVNENIRYFGGDPNRVTIFGESAGSWSTSLQILSPISRNLFQNAILMSGSSINGIAGDEPQNIMKNWLIGAQAIGCGSKEIIEQNKFSKDVIKCLKNATAEKLAGIPMLPDSKAHTPLGWMSQVVVDQQFLPKLPLEMLKTGDFKRNINLLVGTVEDEGSYLLEFDVDTNKYSHISPQNLSYSESYSELTRISQMLLSKKPIDGQTVAKVYFNRLSEKSCPDLLRRTIGIAIGDYLLACPTIQFAKTLYESDKKSKVYQYYYTSKLGKRTAKILGANWRGACHFDDVYPVFGVPFYQPSDFVDEERELSERMIEMFTTFAKKGKLPAQEGAEWPEYFTVNGNTIAPYFEIGEQKKDTNFGEGLKITECEYLWKTYSDTK